MTKRKRATRTGNMKVERQVSGYNGAIRARLVEVTVDQRLEGSEGVEPRRYLGEEFPRQGKAVERPPAGWGAWCWSGSEDASRGRVKRKWEQQ